MKANSVLLFALRLKMLERFQPHCSSSTICILTNSYVKIPFMIMETGHVAITNTFCFVFVS